MILLIDARRNFLDGREALVARSANDALTVLQKREKDIDILWLDSEFQSKDDMKPVIDFLVLRAKVKMPYKLKMINIHAPSEGGWQLLSTRLKNAGYMVRRESIRETLGSY